MGLTRDIITLLLLLFQKQVHLGEHSIRAKLLHHSRRNHNYVTTLSLWLIYVVYVEIKLNI